MPITKHNQAQLHKIKSKKLVNHVTCDFRGKRRVDARNGDVNRAVLMLGRRKNGRVRHLKFFAVYVPTARLAEAKRAHATKRNRWLAERVDMFAETSGGRASLPKSSRSTTEPPRKCQTRTKKIEPQDASRNPFDHDE